MSMESWYEGEGILAEKEQIDEFQIITFIVYKIFFYMF